MSRVGGDKWEVTVAAPAFFHGDLQTLSTAKFGGERAELELIPAYLSALPHIFFYGRRLRDLLDSPWDIVHCWEEPYVIAGGQVAYWTQKQSRLVFWTGQTRVKNYPPPFAQVERYCFKRCAGWLSRGQLGIDTMLQRGHGNRPFAAIGLGVDLDVFFPDQEAGLTVMRQLGWSEDRAASSWIYRTVCRGEGTTNSSCRTRSGVHTLACNFPGRRSHARNAGELGVSL
jgi:hypothetical protein